MTKRKKSKPIDINKMLKNPSNCRAFLTGLKKGLNKPKLNKLTGSLGVYSADMFIIHPDNSKLN